MRVASANMVQKLKQRLASIPVLKLYLFWENSFNTVYTTNDKLLNVGPITTQSRADSSGSVGSCTLTIDDIDSSIKVLLDTFQAENMYARIDLTFDDLNESVVLLLGTINNISWSEGQRSITLTVESETKSIEMGFTPTVEEYYDLNPDASGVAWPIVFGTPTHVPAVRVKHQPEGYLQSYVQLTSTVFKTNAQKLSEYTAPTVDEDSKIASVIAGNGDVVPTKTIVYLTDRCDVLSYEYLEGDEVTTSGDRVTNKMYIRNGQFFPQGTEVKIEIANIIFKGIFNNNVFTVSEANCAKYNNLAIGPRGKNINGTWEPDADKDLKNPTVLYLATDVSIVNCHVYIRSKYGSEPYYNKCIKQLGNKCWFAESWFDTKKYYFAPNEGYSIDSVYPIEKCGLLTDISEYFYHAVNYAWVATDGANMPYAEIIQHLREMVNQNNFWSAPEESEVTLWSEDDNAEIYVCNLIPSTRIRSVYAYRTVKIPGNESRKIFSPVPMQYYTKHLSYTINGYDTTAITMKKSLSSYKGQGWDDQIYVTLTSSVGPNVTDIIGWILSNFVNVQIDSASFNLVSSWVDVYPTSFAVLEKANALRLCQQLAWESKCALSIINGTAILYYLPLIPAPVITLDESAIEEKSLEISYSPIEEITTKFVLDWKDSYKPRDLNIYSDSKRRHQKDNYHLTIGEQNINVYGVIEDARNIISYNVVEYVNKTGNFWLNRMSNSWVKGSCKTFMQGVLPTPFDGVFLSVFQDYFYNTFAVVESTSFDWNTKTTTINFALPIRQGTTVVDLSYWTLVDLVPSVTNPSFKYKEIAYARETEIQPVGKPPQPKQVIGKIVFAGPTFSGEPSESPLKDPEMIIGSDLVTVSLAKNNSLNLVTSNIVGFTQNYWDSAPFVGERFVGKTNTSYVEIEKKVDDYIVSVTSTNSGLGAGYYLGTLCSAGEVFASTLSKNPTTTLSLSVPTGQGTKCIVMNLGETSARAWTKPVINDFPFWTMAKKIEKYQNGIIVVSIEIEAKVIRNIRYNTSTDYLQGSYLTNPTVDGDWFNIVQFVSCT